MQTQKFSNLLSSSENEYSKFATKRWYVIDIEAKGNYSHKNSIKFLTSSLESSLCYYSDARVLVTGNIAVEGADDDTKVTLKNCALFRICRTEINDTFTSEAEHINIAMPIVHCLLCLLNIAIIILILQEVCGNLKEMK